MKKFVVKLFEYNNTLHIFSYCYVEKYMLIFHIEMINEVELHNLCINIIFHERFSKLELFYNLTCYQIQMTKIKTLKTYWQ